MCPQPQIDVIMTRPCQWCLLFDKRQRVHLEVYCPSPKLAVRTWSYSTTKAAPGYDSSTHESPNCTCIPFSGYYRLHQNCTCIPPLRLLQCTPKLYVYTPSQVSTVYIQTETLPSTGFNSFYVCSLQRLRTYIPSQMITCI